MLFDVDLGEDAINLLEELENDLETSTGVTFDLQLADDTSDLTDVMGTEMYFEAVLNDLITVTDQLTIDTAFTTDPISVSDQILVSMTYGAVVSDSVAVTDAVARGFDLIGVAQDTLALTDGLFTNLDYSLSISDILAVSDVIHTWSEPADGVLQVDFEGDGELNAVLVKRKPPPAVVSAAPPRVTLLPRPPKEITTHNVVNPNPPNREER